MGKEDVLCLLDAKQEKALDIFLYTLFALLSIVSVVALGSILIDDPEFGFGRLKFSIEPIIHSGLDVGDHGGLAAAPEFNVTLHATSTHKHRYCGQSTTVRVVYADFVLAIARMDPFCVEGKETSVLAATASPGWPALPPEFRERIQSDRRDGKAQVEVDVKYYNEGEGTMWVRCRTALDAKGACPCKYFSFY